MPTQIPFGHALAKKVYGAAVFAECTRKNSFTKRLTGPAPKQAQAQGKLEKDQTSKDYPFVRVTDLSKGQGATVSIDLFNVVTGKPVMGDESIQGKRLTLSSSSQDIKINQMRFGIDPGGRMAQQRTVHQLRGIGKSSIVGLWGRCLDQVKLVHAGGARGDMNTSDWVVPLATDPDFAKIMVNTVKAPSYNRHFYAGDATDIETLDTTDILTLSDIDKLRAAIDEMDMPLQPVMLPDDPAADEDPMFVLYVTSRQWHYLSTQTGATAWRTFLMNAQKRGSKNPLFSGEPGMWNSILVRKMQRGIRFHQASTVTVAKNQATYDTESKTVPTFSAGTPAGRHGVDRAFVLGAQALAEVWGRDSQSGTHMRWWEGEEDDGNRKVASVSGMGGCSKVSFTDSNGNYSDHGVMVLDSYAPDPQHVVIT